MGVSILLIRIILLTLPGLITYIVYYKLVRRKNKNSWEDFLKIFVFSLINYLILFLIKFVINLFKNNPTYLLSYNALFSERAYIPGDEIFFSALIGLFMGFVFSLISKKQYINKIGKKLKVTKRDSEEDVWNDFFDKFGSRYVYVRDQRRNLIYFGFISNYSESDKEREIIINDVWVFSDFVEGKREKLYEVDSLYLSRDKNEITIEVPFKQRIK